MKHRFAVVVCHHAYTLTLICNDRTAPVEVYSHKHSAQMYFFPPALAVMFVIIKSCRMCSFQFNRFVCIFNTLPISSIHFPCFLSKCFFFGALLHIHVCAIRIHDYPMSRSRSVGIRFPGWLKPILHCSLVFFWCFYFESSNSVA